MPLLTVEQYYNGKRLESVSEYFSHVPYIGMTASIHLVRFIDHARTLLAQSLILLQ